MSPSEQTGQSPTRAEWLTALALSALIVAAASVPYVLAYAVPADQVFGGFLINPADGASYFAKMRQGLRGEWLFTLPYTAEPGPGAFIFTYYLFLGHLAGWTGASVDVVYHTARVLGGLALLLTAYWFVGHFFGTPRGRLCVWALYALGSGLGWLAVPLGGFTADLWVAEAIPFLTVFSNAHFGLATALLLLLVGWTVPGLAEPGASPRRLVRVALATTALAIVLPMALLNVGLVLAGVFAWRWLGRRPRKRAGWAREWAAAAVFAAAALPWLAHALWLTVSHPVLAAWNAQNQTPSPPLWDTALSGGVLLMLAVAGAVRPARRRAEREVVLSLWLGLGALALYAPFSLQRRLSIGLWMPLTLLAGLALRDVIWPRVGPRLRPLLLGAMAVLLLPSNLLVYTATLVAVTVRQPEVFLSAPQAAALDWLAAHAGRGLVAAPPALGLWVPARSDARVVYGHPFETVDAEARKDVVEALFAGVISGPAYAADQGVDYVLAEAPRAAWPWPIVFEREGVVVYAVE